jgi:adenylosuccinate lyase
MNMNAGWKLKRNLQKTFGLTSSQRVLLALVEHGCMREEAYTWVQQDAFQAWDKGIDFIEVVSHVDDIFRRLGLER